MDWHRCFALRKLPSDSKQLVLPESPPPPSPFSTSHLSSFVLTLHWPLLSFQGSCLEAHSACRILSPRGCWVTVDPISIAPEDLQAQAVHRTCPWTLVIGLEEAQTPDSLSHLALVHAHNDPRLNETQVCLHYGKGVGMCSKNGQRCGEEVIPTEILGEKKEATLWQALLQALGARCWLAFQSRQESYRVSFALELTVFQRFKTH